MLDDRQHDINGNISLRFYSSTTVFKFANSNAAFSRNLRGGACVLKMGAQRACTQATPRKLSAGMLCYARTAYALSDSYTA